jgi:hypothetical protein
MSDIVLDDAPEQISVQCNTLKVGGFDFLLDSSARRRPDGSSPVRRALVHDQNDGITLNFANDYPGGVTVGGNMKAQGPDLLLDFVPRRRPDGPDLRRALVHDEHDGLTLNFNNDYPGGVHITDVRTLEFLIFHEDEITVDGRPAPIEKVILSDVIKALRREIADLRAQIAQLQHP